LQYSFQTNSSSHFVSWPVLPPQAAPAKIKQAKRHWIMRLGLPASKKWWLARIQSSTISTRGGETTGGTSAKAGAGILVPNNRFLRELGQASRGRRVP
jgi:hypothetical protein